MVKHKREYIRDIIIENAELPIIMTQHRVNGAMTRVIRDDIILGGTKMRAIFPVMEQYMTDDKNEFIYAGPSTGFAIMAIALAAYALGAKARLYVQNYGMISPILATVQLIPNVRIIYEKTSLKALQKSAKEYETAHKNAVLLSTGSMSSVYFDNLYQMLRDKDAYLIDETHNQNKAIDIIRENPSKLSKYAKCIGKFCETITPRDIIYLVAGSGTVYDILHLIFPKVPFHIVQVGKKIWPDQLHEGTTLSIAPEKFYDPAKMTPSWDTVLTYDAKVYQFIRKHTGCIYIYNIAGLESLDTIAKLFSKNK